ncbi:TRAP transporter TatT component family protein [Myxococcota bacterium]|nr:TRAP transporter TatT component family protein [Myxococcota bacterium]
MSSSTLIRVALLTLALPSMGCIKSMLINGQIEGTRQGSAAFDTISDYELAEQAASSGIVQFEGMLALAPGNPDALFLLTKGWTGYAYGFAEDHMEEAEDTGERELAEYHRRRAITAYDRALGYGLQLLGQRDGGFDAVKKSEPGVKAWLAEHFTSKDDAGDLFWTGYAWVARANLMKDDAEAVANLYVGVAILERAMALDESYNSYSALVVLGAYHARTATAELDEAKRLFDLALEKTQGKAQLTKLQYAIKYACAKMDAAMYTKFLQEVVASEESPEELRLMNTIAKRKAKRWLGEKRMFDMCSLEPVAADTPAETPAS